MVDEYERPTRYFLNLEKRNHNIKHIRSLNVGGHRINDPKEILNTQANFYKNLYSSESNQIPNVFEYEEYFNSITVPLVSNDMKEHSDQAITKEEIFKAINDLKNNKNP